MSAARASLKRSAAPAELHSILTQPARADLRQRSGEHFRDPRKIDVWCAQLVEWLQRRHRLHRRNERILERLLGKVTLPLVADEKLDQLERVRIIAEESDASDVDQARGIA